MAKIKAKVLRYENITVEEVFNKESDLLKTVQQGKLDQALIVWQCHNNTLVLPSGNKWQHSDSLAAALKQLGWQLYARKTGGAPVPQCKGVINLSYLYALPKEMEYSIPTAYREFCDVLTHFFKQYGIAVDAHATKGSYCDGDYNLNINGKKVVGTAQRVVLKQTGGKVVLAQACILIDAISQQLVAPVNLCYQHHQQREHVIADVHTCLFDHIKERPTTAELFQSIYNSFVAKA